MFPPGTFGLFFCLEKYYRLLKRRVKMSEHDVIIVGAGPAGIFTALELIKHNNNLKILIIEKGLPLEERVQIIQENIKKEPTATISGWGGAGAFSDGKLTLSTHIGGWLTEYVNDTELLNLINYVDSIYKDFGGPEKEHGLNKHLIDKAVVNAQNFGLSLIPSKIRHLGTDICHQILARMEDFLKDKVQIITKCKVDEILVENSKVVGVRTIDGDIYKADSVVVAPGRVGAGWMIKQARKLNLGLANNTVDIGVRVEIPAKVLEPLTSILYEPKLVYISKLFNDPVRTFCVNPYGVVSLEIADRLVTVNGHSFADKRTENTNFALLVSTKFTEPFKEPIDYGKYIARLANLLGDGILVQRLGDLRAGRRSTQQRIDEGSVRPTLSQASPGDLSFALPYRYIIDILEMLEAMDELAPGVNDDNNLLYGIEVKFYSARVKLTSELETNVKNLYTIGDGAGVSRGLVQSSASGVIVARSILSRF
jgi:uncharacterized FAD-dependent dehydrogenase